MTAERGGWPGGWGARALTTTVADGDFALGGDPPALAARRRAVVDRPWVWLRQVHGATVHVVDEASADAVAGADGDALVTRAPDLALAVQTADCVPVALTSPERVVGVAHAGWRGLEAGIVEATVAAMRSLGATTIRAAVGPHIGVGCYEFGAADLDRLVARFGPAVAGRTADGRPALDTTAATWLALAAAGAEPAEPPPPGLAAGGCTACDGARWFSHRARGDAGRLATVVWRPA